MSILIKGMEMPKDKEIILRIDEDDVVPAVHGKWLHERIFSEKSVVKYFYTTNCVCSICGIFAETESNYCPNCGAKMKMKSEGEE